MKKEVSNQRTNVLDHKRYDKNLLVRISILKNGDTLLNSSIGRGIYFKWESIKSNRDLKMLKHYINKKNGNFKQIEEELIKILKERGDDYGSEKQRKSR